MGNDVMSFHSALELLWKIQKDEWKNHSSQRRRQEKQVVDQRLAKYLLSLEQGIPAGPINWVEDNKLLSLPPLRRDPHMVPYLTVFYDGNSEETSCCRIYVLMVTMLQQNLTGIGFRIESPERNCQNNPAQQLGSHDFYHAQIVRNVRNWRIYDTPGWLPDSQPSFPLWALRPLDALLNLILTLYGAQFYLDLLKSYKRRFPGNLLSQEFLHLHQRLAGYR